MGMDLYGLAQVILAVATLAGVMFAGFKARQASVKADESHAVVREVKDLAVKTELQTNDRLSRLDEKVAEHEKRCLESMRIIAELKMALAEALRSKHEPSR